MDKNENNENIDVEKLGKKKLNLNIKYLEVDKGNNIRMLDGTIKEFLKSICITSYDFTEYDKQIHFAEMEALNKNKVKIKNIVDYVAGLNAETLADNGSDKDGQNSRLVPKFEKRDDLRQEEQQIAGNWLFKKTYMILQLIKWGVNPFEIRECLKQNKNNDFNWNWFLECVIDNKIIFSAVCYGYELHETWDKIKYMYFFEPLFQNSKNLSESLKPFDFKFLLCTMIGTGLVTSDASMPFILQ